MSELKVGKYQAYSEYKDSGYHSLGLVPKHWIVCKLKHIKSETTNAFVDGPFGSNLKSEHFVDNGDIYVIESNFATTGKLDTTNLKTISESHFNTICRSETKEGAIVIAKIGARYGMSSILPAINKKAVVSGNSLSLQINKSKMDLNFCHNVLTHQKVEGAMDDGVNVTAQPALSLGQLNNLPFVNPPLIEQQKIANFLDHETAKIDTLIEKQQQLIKLLKEKRQAVISHAVTKGLNPNAPMKDSGVEWLGEVPKHWSVSKVKYLAELTPKKTEVENLKNTLCSFIPMEKLKKDTLVLDEIRQVSVVFDGYTYFKNEDLLVAKVTPCFENQNMVIARGLHNGIGFGSSEIYVLRSKLDCFNDFLYYRLQEDVFMDLATGAMTGAGGLKRVPSDFLNNFQFALPPAQERLEIVEYIKSYVIKFDKLMKYAESAIALMQERRTALISAAVTGKIDVRNWEQSNDE